MCKLQVDSDVIRIVIQQEIGQTEESRDDYRLHGVLLVASDQSCHQVTGCSAKTAPRDSAGSTALSTANGMLCLRGRAGRPATLDAIQWRKFHADLRNTPRDFAYWPRFGTGRCSGST